MVTLYSNGKISASMYFFWIARVSYTYLSELRDLNILNVCT